MASTHASEAGIMDVQNQLLEAEKNPGLRCASIFDQYDVVHILRLG